jgi:hypothetical protein
MTFLKKETVAFVLVAVAMLFFFTQAEAVIPPTVTHGAEHVSSTTIKAMVGSTGTKASYLAVDDSGKVKISGTISAGTITVSPDTAAECDKYLHRFLIDYFPYFSGIYVRGSQIESLLAITYFQSADQVRRDSTMFADSARAANTLFRQIAAKSDTSLSVLVLIKAYQAIIAGLSNDIYNKTYYGDSSVVANIINNYNRLRDIVVSDSELVVTSYRYLVSIDSILKYIDGHIATTHIEGCDLLADTMTCMPGVLTFMPTPWSSGLYNQKTIFINKGAAGSATDSVYVIGSWTSITSDGTAYAYRNTSSYGFLVGTTSRYMFSIPPIYLPFTNIAVKNNHTDAFQCSVRACGKSNHGE